MRSSGPHTNHTPGAAYVTKLYTVRTEKPMSIVVFTDSRKHTSTEGCRRRWKPSACYKSAEDWVRIGLTNFHLAVPSLAMRTYPSITASFPLTPFEDPMKNISGCFGLAERWISDDWKNRISALGMMRNLISINLVASRKRGSSKNLGCSGPCAMSEYCEI